jgi:CheY-like chemotaxis protein
MNRKLNCILLIDDDEPTNFLHKFVIEKTGFAEKCVTVQNGQEALDYLKREEDGKYPQPDLIFLDINMPRMNGWEFLDEYEKLEKAQKGNIVVVMLTTSLDPSDKEKAEKKIGINEFMSKPLTAENVEEIIKRYFS